MTAQRAGERAKLKIGPEHVAWVKEEMCIGCDQCTIVCDDDAIELYDVKMRSPIIDVDINKKAKILRDPCTCLLYTSPSPRDRQKSRMPSSA